jgi:predicted naringenin-chalcone synthase
MPCLMWGGPFGAAETLLRGAARLRRTPVNHQIGVSASLCSASSNRGPPSACAVVITALFPVPRGGPQR